MTKIALDSIAALQTLGAAEIVTASAAFAWCIGSLLGLEVLRRRGRSAVSRECRPSEADVREAA